MPASPFMLAQTKLKTEHDEPLLSNRTVAIDAMAAAVSSLVTLTVCNSEPDPKYSMVPSPDEFGNPYPLQAY